MLNEIRKTDFNSRNEIRFDTFGKRNMNLFFVFVKLHKLHTNLDKNYQMSG